LFPDLCDLAEEAGRAILSVYDGDYTVHAKVDNSPVTAADLASDALIIDGLKRLTPDIAIITEETFDGVFSVAPDAPFWCVDPLDGTKEFIAHSGEFTVNIGLVENGKSVLGVINIPVANETYWGGPGQGSWMRDAAGARAIKTRAIPAEGMTVLSSRYHGNTAKLDTYLADRKVAYRKQVGSTLKFCTIAKGEADLYPHFGTGTCEWDTAAGQAILEAAGGTMQLLSGGEMTYGKPGLRNPGYVVRGA
jgi:3'(2'), 5'-bisphosphate nucleotidase